MNETAPTPSDPTDIVESELEHMLEIMIDARCGLSAIHRLLDGAQTMDELRQRFLAWQLCHTDGPQNGGAPL